MPEAVPAPALRRHSKAGFSQIVVVGLLGSKGVGRVQPAGLSHLRIDAMASQPLLLASQVNRTNLLRRDGKTRGQNPAVTALSPLTLPLPLEVVAAP